MPAFAANLFGTVFWSAIGYGVALLLYNGSREKLTPDTHAPESRLQTIVEENVSLDTSAILEPDFYLNATDRELFSIYNQPSTTKNQLRLAQVVFEARRRVGN